MTYLLKNRRAEKQLFAWIQKGQKAARQRESAMDKERTLILCKLWGVVAEGSGDVDVDVDEWEPGVLITSPCDSISVSEG